MTVQKAVIISHGRLIVWHAVGPGIKGRVHVTQGFHGFSVKSAAARRSVNLCWGLAAACVARRGVFRHLFSRLPPPPHSPSLASRGQCTSSDPNIWYRHKNKGKSMRRRKRRRKRRRCIVSIRWPSFLAWRQRKWRVFKGPKNSGIWWIVFL